MPSFFSFFLFFFFFSSTLFAQVVCGIDVLLRPENIKLLEGKKVGLIVNQTAVDRHLKPVLERFLEKAKGGKYQIAALFAPEHGIKGSSYAAEAILDQKTKEQIPIFSLYGKTRRPTKEMLKGIDLLIYDIQDIGSRSYTYLTTLCYVMEEAAKLKIPVFVLDRPNPINGLVVDGFILEERWKSMVGYPKVPYCHGMTIGELASYFNEKEQVGCLLTVIRMEGWKREMSFSDTQLPFVPTSPNIPELSTPLFYPMTGILGELSLVSIGVGYTLPFKVVGAPWIEEELFASQLNKQKFPGVAFYPFSFRPMSGKFVSEMCHGVLIFVTDPKIYLPVATQYLLIGMLKSLYPKEFEAGLKKSLDRKEMFCKVNGCEEVIRLMEGKEPIIWKLRTLLERERKKFLEERKPYLLY